MSRTETSTAATAAAHSEPALGTVLRIDEATVLVLGQELDVAAEQPDVANSLLHRVGDTLFLVDTGVTTEFRTALVGAADKVGAVDMVGPWSRLVVLTTHGHVDHVGNNDLADELAATRGITAEHYLPARDLPQIIDPAGYWVHSFERVPGVVPLPAPPSLAGAMVNSLFTPMHPFAAVTRTYEELPLERIPVGSVPMTGWTFADGAVQVLRTQGHCAGHVIVRLADIGLLHLSDEGNGPCGIMADADQLKLQTCLGAVLTMAREGCIGTLTDGHTFTTRTADEAATYLETLLDQAVGLQEVALDVTRGKDSVRPSEFVREYGKGVADLGVGGANPSLMFTGMMGINQLREIGLTPTSGKADAPWTRPELVRAKQPAGRPTGLALVPAAVRMIRWKLAGRDR
ncbi:MBL fold metallo-hydrolase [Nakamurella sp. YIM 132087]|uniref:MBL fold metallo-hydrolase n=1 Tax=Nakamurella alba TaxID=2665158 RepID=A0A7K1FPD1_9ACTN|nr:MBL fold metallo-hydrolase [Nakamurella alba]MTD15997.1 MBL fold metallo-hydrolase [Nakamurella alba]